MLNLHTEVVVCNAVKLCVRQKLVDFFFLQPSKYPNKCVPGCVCNRLSYLAALTGAHTIMVARGLVTAYHTGLVDPGWRGRGGGHAYIRHCSRTLHLIHSLRVKHLTCKKSLKTSQSWYTCWDLLQSYIDLSTSCNDVCCMHIYIDSASINSFKHFYIGFFKTWITCDNCD